MKRFVLFVAVLALLAASPVWAVAPTAGGVTGCTSVTTASTIVLNSNNQRQKFLCTNNDAAVAAYCAFGTTLTGTAGHKLAAGANWEETGVNVGGALGVIFKGELDCITASSTATVCCTEN